MINKLKLGSLLVVGLVVALGFVGGLNQTQAAYNDVTFSADTLVYIPGLGINLTIVSGSKVASFVVNAASIDFNMESGSTVQVRSTTRNNLSGVGAGMQCSTNYSEIGKDALSTITWTVTPSSGTCTPAQASGGGSTTTTTTTTTTATTTPVVTVTPIIPVVETPIVTTTPTVSAIVVKALPYASPKTTVEMQANLNVLIENLAVLQAAQKAISAPAAAPTAGSVPSAGSYKVGLTPGSKGNDVTALQNFLKAQGADIYPEGMVTGFYGNLTKAAVAKFQMKYGIVTSASDPGYGNVGPKTRAKINQLLGL